MARPATTADGTVVGPGTDLNMEGGLADNVKDMIILTAGSQVLQLLTSMYLLGKASEKKKKKTRLIIHFFWIRGGEEKRRVSGPSSSL